MGTLLWLNAVTLKRAPTPLFGRLVRCSAHGRSFVRLWYTQLHVYQQGSITKVGLELSSIQSGTHDDDLQVIPLLHNLEGR